MVFQVRVGVVVVVSINVPILVAIIADLAVVVLDMHHIPATANHTMDMEPQI